VCLGILIVRICIITKHKSIVARREWQLEGARLKGNLVLHLIFALSASGLIWVLCGWRVRQQGTPKQPPGRVYFALALGTFVLIALAGHLGGILSGVEDAPM
jgi:hypothetical protein